MAEKTFIYTVLAYDDKTLKPDNSGYLYHRDAVVRVIARDEQMALQQAQAAIQDRKYYDVIECNERT